MLNPPKTRIPPSPCHIRLIRAMWCIPEYQQHIPSFFFEADMCQNTANFSTLSLFVTFKQSVSFQPSRLETILHKTPLSFYVPFPFFSKTLSFIIYSRQWYITETLLKVHFSWMVCTYDHTSVGDDNFVSNRVGRIFHMRLQGSNQKETL
uniref:Uncharacterized protein n=1 Tax=Cacopsylla melanoneura TaxID=428564 RepID=A0A8D8YIU6_9HEMI